MDSLHQDAALGIDIQVYVIKVKVTLTKNRKSVSDQKL